MNIYSFFTFYILHFAFYFCGKEYKKLVLQGMAIAIIFLPMATVDNSTCKT